MWCLIVRCQIVPAPILSLKIRLSQDIILTPEAWKQTSQKFTTYVVTASECFRVVGLIWAPWFDSSISSIFVSIFPAFPQIMFDEATSVRIGGSISGLADQPHGLIAPLPANPV